MTQQYYIHIGTPKTGSTSIQGFMDVNRDVLKRDGVYYPQMGKASHNQLFFAKKGYRRLGLNEQRRAWKKLIASARKSRAPKVVVSAEVLVQCDSPEVAQIRDLFAGEDVSIICYMRRQDLFLNSRYLQLLKSGNVSLSLDEFLADARYSPKPLDMIRHWAQCFGDEKLLVVPFERSSLQPSLVQNFLNCIDLPMKSDYKMTPSKNISPSPEIISMLVELARWEREGGITAAERKSVLSAFSSTNYRESGGKKQKVTLLTPEQQRTLIAVCQSDYEEIARRFLGRADGIMFNDPVMIDESGGGLPPVSPLGTFVMLNAIEMAKRFDRLEKKFFHKKILRGCKKLAMALRGDN